MSKINGIYAASMSIIDNDLTLNVTKTIQHAEMSRNIFSFSCGSYELVYFL